MLSIREKAEVYKLGLLIGYFNVEEFLKWIDEVIENEENPDIGIIEIAYSGNKSVNDLISLISFIDGECDFKNPVKVLLGLMYKDYLDDEIELSNLTSQLYSLSQHLTEQNLQKDKINELNTMDDYYYIYSEMQIKQRLKELLDSYVDGGVYQWLR